MCYNSSQKWTLLILTTFIRWANVQMAYPVFMPAPPPMIAMPPPMPVPVPIIAIEIPDATKSTTTTTTTTERNVAIAIPVPVPMPVHVGIPAFAPAFCVTSPRPKNCPPCPPCLCMPQCTPAFFSYCSPCHQKCRCRNPGDAPAPLPPPVPVPGPAYPMPMPMMPAPPPVMIVPIPPQIPRRQRRRKPQPCSSSSEDSSDDTSSDCEHQRRGKKFKRRRLRVIRRKASSESENELVKPVLTYVSENGDVKYEKQISHDDVDRMLGKNSDARRYKTVRVLTRDDESNKQQLVVISNDETGDGPHRYKQVLLRNGPGHRLSSGKKELVFKPPGDKRISNLSVSFQIEKR